MKVENIMVRDVRCCGSRDSVAQAARIMWEEDCGCVPVVDDHRRVIGMLTDRDVCMAVSFGSRPAHEIRVTDPMSKTVHACRPTDSIESAAKTMRTEKVRRLPVIDVEDRLVGVLSLNDLVRESAREHEQGAKVKIDDALLRRTLAAVSEPRALRPV